MRTLVLLAGILDALGMTLVYPYVGYCCGRGSRCSNRTTRGLPEQRWAYDLAIAIQASLFVFCVAGAARSMAYYDLFIIEIALLLPLREIILPERKQKRPKWAPPHAAVPQRMNYGCSEGAETPPAAVPCLRLNLIRGAAER